MAATLLCMAGVQLYGHAPITTHAAVSEETRGSSPSGVRFHLVDSIPTPGAWLRAAPREVVLEFSHDIEGTGSEVRLQRHRDDHPIEGALTRATPRRLIFVPDQALPEGTYYVDWTVSTPEGDQKQGRFHFTVARGESWQVPLDRREVNRELGDLTPGRLLVIPAVLGVAGLVWILWTVSRR